VITYSVTSGTNRNSGVGLSARQAVNLYHRAVREGEVSAIYEGTVLDGLCARASRGGDRVDMGAADRLFDELVSARLSRAFRAGIDDGLDWDLDGFDTWDAAEAETGWDEATINAMGVSHCAREWRVDEEDEEAWGQACTEYESGVRAAVRYRAALARLRLAESHAETAEDLEELRLSVSGCQLEIGYDGRRVPALGSPPSPQEDVLARLDSEPKSEKEWEIIRAGLAEGLGYAKRRRDLIAESKKITVLDPDKLREVVEQYAEGSFEELFDIEWTDIDSFKKAALDYVHTRHHAEFVIALREGCR
jgi:hypothetical protein